VRARGGGPGGGADKRRVVMLLDMDAFFASVEQRTDPSLAGRPIAVVGSAERTVVTTASYEARAWGVRTGMNKFEAKRLCPRLLFVVGNNRKYMDTSMRVLAILKRYSPLVEVYSIDEAFVELTGTGGLLGPPRAVAMEIKERIRGELGLTCSVGIAPNKLLAKLAAGMEKPDGLVEIGPGDVAGVLEDLPAGELWGIGPRLAAHLGAMGVRTCGQLGRFPAGLLRKRFGIIGERLKLMGLGVDHSPVVPEGEAEEVKSVGHSMTLPADLSDRAAIRRQILKLSEKVAARARRHGLAGTTVSVTVRYPDFHTFGRSKTLGAPTSDTRVIYRAALDIIGSIRLRSAVRLLGVCLSGITRGPLQMRLFEEDRRREALLKALDSVNGLYGERTLSWATLFDQEDGPGVISPSWRPAGARRVEVK